MSSRKRPKISVIVPTFNSQRTLSQCLKSIGDQTYSYHETIVVDNFSDDGTLKTIKEFGAEVMQRQCNPGLARSIGVANATGQYVLFLDSDQVLSARVIEECVEKCVNENAGMARIPEIFIGKGFWGSCSALWKNYYGEVEQLYWASGNVIQGEPRFFRKEELARVGVLHASLLWGEDYILHEKLRRANIREALCKSKIYHYELASVKEVLIKNLRYGKSMPVFLRQTQERIFPLMFRHSILTFREVFRNLKKSPAVIVGCVVLFWLKTCSTAIGLLIGAGSHTGGKENGKLCLL